MKLLKLSYCDRYSGWSIDSCEFFPDLNLLVGISGAGKTSILIAINDLKYIVNGESRNGVKWDVEFLTSNNILYHWSGEFEFEPEKTDNFTIIGETIVKKENTDSEVIVARDRDRTLFKNLPTPKLSPSVSIIELFNQEEEFRCIKESFKNIIFNTVNLSGANYLGSPFNAHRLQEENIDYKKLILDNPCTPILNISTKFLFAYRYNKKIFDSIKEKFLNIFSQVEDLKIDDWLSRFPDRGFAHYTYSIQIKEKKSERWMYMVASGMVKSLFYLATLELSPPGSVILIDEFENSLGVNCLDSLTENFLLGSRDLQFIITSHHPYIINNISPGHWKIITRKGGVSTARNAGDYNISKSRQKAFIDLVNVLDEFPEGLDKG